jgi:hypothetical protein
MSNLSVVLVDADGIAAPGNSVDLYFTFADELTGYPLTEYETTPSTATSAANKKTLATAFAFVTTTKIGYWRRVKAKLNTPMSKATLQGDNGFISSLDFELVDDGAEARVFADEMAVAKRGSDGLVVLVKNPDTGHLTVIGTKERPAEVLTAELTSGDKPGGAARGSKFSIGAGAKNTPHIYPKTLTLKTTANA